MSRRRTTLTTAAVLAAGGGGFAAGTITAPGPAAVTPAAVSTWRAFDAPGAPQHLAAGPTTVVGWEPLAGTPSDEAVLYVRDADAAACAKFTKGGTRVQENVALALVLKVGLCVRGRSPGRVRFTQ